MKAIVVVKKYYNYEDSYSKILGVCSSDEKADELIEKEKHTHDHQKITRENWYALKREIRYDFEEFEEFERNSPKKGGFLKRFNYDCLYKSFKKAYDILKEKFDGRQYTSEVFREMSSQDRYCLIQLLTRANILKDLSYDEYKEICDFFSTDDNGEDPDNITYKKEEFDII